MSLQQLRDQATSRDSFRSLSNYIDFASHFLAFGETGFQADIVSQNEQQYHFYQFKADGFYRISRPINTTLMVDADTLRADLLSTLRQARDLAADDNERRSLLRNGIYTLQQSIGAVLDSLPENQSNRARKLNGELFERLIRLTLHELGVACTTGSVSVPVIVGGAEQFRMKYQHDLIIKAGDVVKAIGSVKTTSKDRIGKVFVDKFLYTRMTDTALPHIAIFLHDVQRSGSMAPNRHRITSTFLPGHFKGYTVKLNPLDGVYYCDLRPNMTTDPLLSAHIKPLDRLLCNDLWHFLARPTPPIVPVETAP